MSKCRPRSSWAAWILSASLETQPRSVRRQAAFACVVIAREKILSDDQLQDRIAQKFQALIIEVPPLSSRGPRSDE